MWSSLLLAGMAVQLDPVYLDLEYGMHVVHNAQTMLRYVQHALTSNTNYL